MSTKAVTPDAPAASPSSIEQALESGFLPSDPYYRKTGKFRDQEEPSVAKESADTEEASAASDADIDAAPAAAQEQEKVESHQKSAKSSENRWAKITRENRELRDRLARLEAAPRETKQESQPAQPEVKESGRPKIDDVDPKTGQAKYKTYADYEQAKDDWLRSETLRQFREESIKTQREQAQAQAERQLVEGMVKKFESARSKYADFDKVALGEHLLIPKGSVTDAFLLDSDHAGEVAYYLGQHPEITQGFYGDYNAQTGQFVNRVTPQRQFRRLMEIENDLSGAKQATPAKPVTQAPRPPHQLSGKSAVAKDAVEQAVDEQDMRTYMREQNARDKRVQALRNRK